MEVFARDAILLTHDTLGVLSEKGLRMVHGGDQPQRHLAKHDPGQLKVRVRDVSCRVGRGANTRSDVRRKWHKPDCWWEGPIVPETNTAGTHFTRVNEANCGRFRANQFCHVSWAGGQVLDDIFEVKETGTKLRFVAQPNEPFLRGESLIHGSK